LTERTEVGLSYQFSDVWFSNVPVRNILDARVIDYQTHSVGAEWLTRVTERDRLALIFEGQRYEADDDRQFDNYDLEAGVVHEFSETATGLLTVGARHTTFEPGITGGEEDSNTGFGVILSGTKRTGLTIFAGTLGRSAEPSASGDLVETDQLFLNVSRQLSERMRLILRSIVFETEVIDDMRSGSNGRFVAIQPRLRYELSPGWALETGYKYRRQKRFAEPDSADSNAVFLSLVYERPTVVEPVVSESYDDLGKL
jgi:hypothetical protein